MQNILQEIICETYEKEFRRNPEKVAMLIPFILKNKKRIELLLIWEGYVGIFVNNNGKWTCLSCHDSCWREDGVNRFLSEYIDQLLHIDFTCGWYGKIKISEIDETLRKIERERNS